VFVEWVRWELIGSKSHCRILIEQINACLQESPVFVRIMDRDSHRRHQGGLRSVIPTVLLFGILGYPVSEPF